MYLETIKLPVLITAADYHEFGDVEAVLKKLNRSLRCAEVGFNGSEYVGVVYAGRKPVKAELRDLAAEQRVVLEEQE